LRLGSEDARLLAEIGYAAAGHGLGEKAEPIFAALAAWRPASAAAGIGRALAALARGRAEDAAWLLRRQALAAEPDNRGALVLLGLALDRAGHKHESRRVLGELVEADPGDASAETARRLMAQSRTS
jgi:thioredoxin-like negative regulator of GroEL